MITYLPCAAAMPARRALPYPRSATWTTRAPPAAAIACEPSVLPLSAITTSPVQPLRARKARALEMQLAKVSASLRHGIRMVNSHASLIRSSPRLGNLPAAMADDSCDDIDNQVILAKYLLLPTALWTTGLQRHCRAETR